mmetsp:Transcript_34248/g.85329  ORF Transcript_34248/g.85329 Transcript_34248/m.85329 type:complete len:163 (-) Transcript_34248:178-666(-)
MMRDVRAMQQSFERAAWENVRDCSENTSLTTLTARARSAANNLMSEWWSLPDYLIQKYADGWLNDGPSLGYPDAWLKLVGYVDGPPQPPEEPSLPHCCNPEEHRAGSHLQLASGSARVSEIARSPGCGQGIRACVNRCGEIQDDEAFSLCVSRCSTTCIAVV